MTPAKLQSLARVPLFEGLAGPELESVAARVHELEIETGSELMRQGDVGGDFFVVTSGALEIRVDGRVINMLGPGDFVGELALLFGAPRSASAFATEPTSLLVMDKDSFSALLAEQPAVEDKLLAVVAQRMRYR